MNHHGETRLYEPIIDSFGRAHNNLRIGVTDRCNIRCFYCMPNENIRFLPHGQILSFEEITQFVRVVAAAGVNRIRLTGGEPLVRSQLSKLVQLLHGIDGIDEIALTTNGILLADQAEDLKNAGLSRLNISLDTVDPVKFEQIARRNGLERVLERYLGCAKSWIRKNTFERRGHCRHYRNRNRTIGSICTRT